MSEDKRKVSTDALETLGHKISETEKRDAIHLAVIPSVASEYLCPGDHVNSKGEKALMYSDGAIGIVDPFLKETVNPGERFWLIIYPRQIHSLRHVWTHPAFDDDHDQVKLSDDFQYELSRGWIISYANKLISYTASIDEEDITYKNKFDILMDAADKWIKSNEVFEVQSYGESEYHHFDDEFWYHYEIISGTEIETYQKQNFFLCCC